MEEKDKREKKKSAPIELPIGQGNHMIGFVPRKWKNTGMRDDVG